MIQALSGWKTAAAFCSLLNWSPSEAAFFVRQRLHSEWNLAVPAVKARSRGQGSLRREGPGVWGCEGGWHRCMSRPLPARSGRQSLTKSGAVHLAAYLINSPKAFARVLQLLIKQVPSKPGISDKHPDKLYKSLHLLYGRFDVGPFNA